MEKNLLRVTHGKSGVPELPVVRNTETTGLYERFDEEIGLRLLTLPLELAVEKRQNECGEEDDRALPRS